MATPREAQEIAAARDRVIEKVGPWERDNIHLGHGVYTIAPILAATQVRTAHVVQVVEDILGRPIAGLRVLDLGCAEGILAIEMALRGAEVVAVEGRSVHVEKVAFVRDVLGLERLEPVCADVRPLTPERWGSFDVVLCLGLLYHLDVRDAIDFVHGLRSVTRRLLLLDTHFSLRARMQVEHRGRTYSGGSYAEHDPASSREEREQESRASLDNPQSFWFTRPSLYNLLDHAGFTSVLELRQPRGGVRRDRCTLAAFAGDRVTVHVAPEMREWPRYPWREGERIEPVRAQRSAAWRLGRSLLPAGVRAAVKRARRGS